MTITPTEHLSDIDIRSTEHCRVTENIRSSEHRRVTVTIISTEPFVVTVTNLLLSRQYYQSVYEC